MNKSDPLTVLLKIKSEKGFQVDDELIKQCYHIQNEHQYDRDRNTLNKMGKLIESALAVKP